MRKMMIAVAAALALGTATMATGTMAFGRGGGGGGHFGGGGGPDGSWTHARPPRTLSDQVGGRQSQPARQQHHRRELLG
jgi:hypothetical protein